MSYERIGDSQSFSFNAGEDLDAWQFKAVKLNSAGNIVKATVDGEDILGILQDKPKSGEAGRVAMLTAITRWVVAASEALVPGYLVGTNSAGCATRIDPTSTGSDLGDYVQGVVLEAVTGSSPAALVCAVLLRPMGRITA